MGRENRKEAVAALHREQILKAAETLFEKKGVDATTIDDISAASGYSRRTIYAYFPDKEDIMHHLVERGLLFLRDRIRDSVKPPDEWMTKCRSILTAMTEYQRDFPLSLQYVNDTHSAALPTVGELSDTVRRILALGTEINDLLSTLLEEGQKNGLVRRDLNPALSVYVLWSGITSFLSLIRTKGEYLMKQFSLTEQELSKYGFGQILRSILEVAV